MTDHNRPFQRSAIRERPPPKPSADQPDDPTATQLVVDEHATSASSEPVSSAAGNADRGSFQIVCGDHCEPFQRSANDSKALTLNDVSTSYVPTAMQARDDAHDTDPKSAPAGVLGTLTVDQFPPDQRSAEGSPPTWPTAIQNPRDGHDTEESDAETSAGNASRAVATAKPAAAVPPNKHTNPNSTPTTTRKQRATPIRLNSDGPIVRVAAQTCVRSAATILPRRIEVNLELSGLSPVRLPGSRCCCGRPQPWSSSRRVPPARR